jgi:hypothetical protein
MNNTTSMTLTIYGSGYINFYINGDGSTGARGKGTNRAGNNNDIDPSFLMQCNNCYTFYFASGTGNVNDVYIK